MKALLIDAIEEERRMRSPLKEISSALLCYIHEIDNI